MAEWVHVALDALALIFSAFAFFYSWSNRKGEAHKEAMAELKRSLEEEDKNLGDKFPEIFRRLNTAETDMARVSETLKHLPTTQHIDDLRQTINIFTGQIATSIGQVSGELKANSRQVDIMNAYLMREPSR